jgi:hypothetical protein
MYQAEYEDDEIWHVPDEYPVSDTRRFMLYKGTPKVVEVRSP